MDANGTRFELILGRADWARCSEVAPGSGVTTRLAALWDASPPRDAVALGWDAERQELTLRKELTLFVGAPGDRRVTEVDRRSVVADAHGNLYWIGSDQRSVLTRGVEDVRERQFWPRPLPAAAATGDFRAVSEPASANGPEFRALFVSEEGFLVVGTESPGGLLWFDLVSGSPPRVQHFPADWRLVPAGFAPRVGGGFWMLDRQQRRLWEFDRQFRLVTRNDQPVDVRGMFQGKDTSPGCVEREPTLADALAIPSNDPISVHALHDGSLLIVDRHPLIRIPKLRRYHQSRWSKILGLEALAQAFPRGFSFRVHEVAVVPGSSTTLDRMYLIPESGNQAFLVFLEPGEPRWRARVQTDFLPLRLYTGRALAVVPGDVWYDSAGQWVPLRRQDRPRYVREGWVQLPVSDAQLPQAVWHRVMLDGSWPADAQVVVEARAADRESDLAAADWRPQPRPYRRGTGSELPWLSSEASGGRATWELLLQNVRGRFVELRLKLSGNGRVTPRLRAVRLYGPRFSYVKNYLPEIYRDEDLYRAAGGSADFFDRFVANFEGQFTAWEDRIASLQVLLDPRLAPPETLGWLAGWLGAVLDPAWDVARQRLFLRNALELYRWRGTARGLELALRLALDPCLTEEQLRNPDSKAANRSFRLVEHFTRRRALTPVRTDVPTTPGCSPLVTPRWTPDLGAADLHQRYQRAQPAGSAPVNFPVRRPATGSAEWEQFCREQLGFVPLAGWTDREQWQRFLEERYQSLELLNDSHGSEWTDFPTIPLPERLPDSGSLREDWEAFSAEQRGPDETQQALLWQEFLHRRYRSVARLAGAYPKATSFESVVLPAALPVTKLALRDWYEFEGAVLAMQQTAHRFTVLIPAKAGGGLNVAESQRQRLALADRVIRLEKPAHTVYDVQFFWAYFRVGQARLGEDSLLGRSSRLPELLGPFVLGESALAQGYLTEPGLPADRVRLTNPAPPPLS